MKIAAIVSGGMDSVTAAHLIRYRNKDAALLLLSFDYGQRHVRELQCAAAAARRLGGIHRVIHLPTLHGSALTDLSTPVPEGHYAAESMKATVVPNRNMVMLSVAASIAIGERAESLWTGVHAGDHAIYPDCRPEFIDAMNVALRVGNEGFANPLFEVIAPFLHSTKADIARIGEDIGVPWHETWSCYKGGEVHCGRCATCVERQEALHEAGAVDRTVYDDAEFWRTVQAPA